jgi:hypothetical protein
LLRREPREVSLTGFVVEKWDLETISWRSAIQWWTVSDTDAEIVLLFDMVGIKSLVRASTESTNRTCATDNAVNNFNKDISPEVNKNGIWRSKLGILMGVFCNAGISRIAEGRFLCVELFAWVESKVSHGMNGV